MNSLFQQLGGRHQQTSPEQNNIIEMYKALQESGNPQQMLMSLAQQNPQVAEIMREVQASGGDPKSLFYDKARQMGIDPNVILSMLK